MVKIKEHSVDDRKLVIQLSKQGKSVRNIEKELGIPKSTVQDTIKRWQELGRVENLSRAGRPRKTNSRIDKKIVKLAETSSRPNAVDIAKQLEKLKLVNRERKLS